MMSPSSNVLSNGGCFSMTGRAATGLLSGLSVVGNPGGLLVAVGILEELLVPLGILGKLLAVVGILGAPLAVVYTLLMFD